MKLFCRVFKVGDGVAIDIPSSKFQPMVDTCPKPFNLVDNDYAIISLTEVLKIKGEAGIESLYFDGEVSKRALKLRDGVIKEEKPKTKRAKKV